jgi:hypothetical protein
VMSATTSNRAAILRLLTTVMLMTAISQAFGRFTYSLLFTDVRDDLQSSNTAAGSFGSANLAAYLCGSLAVSLIVGRWGLATTARAGLVGVTGGLALMAWSPHVVIALIALVIMGFAAEHWRNIYRIEVLIALAVCLMAFSWISSPPASGVRGGGLASLRKVPAWKSLLFSYGLFAMAMAMVVTFLVALLKEDAGYSDRSAALAFSLLGVGTVAGVPVTVGALVSDHTSGDEFGAAYGVATLAFGTGLAIGPQVGGIIADASDSFRPVLGVAAACAIVGGGLTLIRPDRSSQRRTPRQ